jgi:hypothetical protein
MRCFCPEPAAMVRLMAWAVFRLMTISNFIGASESHLEARQKPRQVWQLGRTRVHIHRYPPCGAEDTTFEPLLTKRYYRLRV